MCGPTIGRGAFPIHAGLPGFDLTTPARQFTANEKKKTFKEAASHSAMLATRAMQSSCRSTCNIMPGFRAWLPTLRFLSAN